MAPRNPALTLRVALPACFLLGILSVLAVPSALGYDPWAWLIWGRELVHLDLHTVGGPSWKPLPALLIAPFTPLEGAAPWIWLATARAATFAAPFFAYRIALKLTGSHVAGAAAALGLVVCDDFFITGLRGYTEPLLIALALAAIDQHLEERPRAALALAALAGLLRPEVWPFIGAYGALLLYRRSASPATVVALVVVAPLLWLALDLVGSGNALEASTVAQTSPQGSAAKADRPALTVLGRAADAVVLPVLLLAFVGAARAIRRRDLVLGAVAGMAVAWIAIVAVMAEAGFTGRRRYLAVAAALLCVVAASGLHALLTAAGRRRSLVLGTVAVAFAVFAFSPARSNYRLIALAKEQKAQLDELGGAVDSARRAWPGGHQPLHAHRARVGPPRADARRPRDLVLVAAQPGLEPARDGVPRTGQARRPAARRRVRRHLAPGRDHGPLARLLRRRALALLSRRFPARLRKPTVTGHGAVRHRRRCAQGRQPAAR